MKQALQPIASAMLAILSDPRANRVERIECAKVLLSCHGCLIPEVNEQWLAVRQVVQLRRIKQQIVERVLRKKAKKRIANRKAFLRRKLRKLQNEQSDQTNRR